MTERDFLLVKGGKCLRNRFRKAIHEDIKRSHKKRSDIAEIMTQILGETITTSQLYNWTAPSHIKHRFPIEYLPAFCRATGQKRALNLLFETSLADTQISLEMEDITNKIEKMQRKKKRLQVFRDEIKKSG